MNFDYPEGPHNRSNEEGLRWLFGINPDMNMQFSNPVNS
jgi:hypothetical protein